VIEGPKAILAAGWSGRRSPKACIVGLGLMGGSWAGALHLSGWEVLAVDREKDSLDEALSRGWIQAGWTEMPTFMDVDLVVLALPLQEFAKGFDQLIGRIPKGAIVTDVGSIKGEICNKSKVSAQTGLVDFHFVGGHPMTGSEQSGFRVADAHLFEGYPYVLTPEAVCVQEVVQKLTEVIEGFGANVVVRDPEDHDREVAMVSHIPHLFAVALTLATRDASKEGKSAFALGGRSFQDITRIADSSPEMWKEVLVRNSEAILSGLTLVEQRIKELREHLELGDREAIAEAFRRAHAVRGCIE